MDDFNLRETLLADSKKVIPFTKPGDPDPLAFPEIMTGAAGEFAEVYSAALEVPMHVLYSA